MTKKTTIENENARFIVSIEATETNAEVTVNDKLHDKECVLNMSLDRFDEIYDLIHEARVHL